MVGDGEVQGDAPRLEADKQDLHAGVVLERLQHLHTSHSKEAQPDACENS